MQTDAQKALVSLSGNGLGDTKIGKLFGCKALAVSLIRSNAVRLNPNGRVEKLMNSTGTTSHLEEKIIGLAHGMCPDSDGEPKSLPKEMWGAL